MISILFSNSANFKHFLANCIGSQSDCMNVFVYRTEVIVLIHSTVDRSVHVVVLSLYILVKSKVLVIARYGCTIHFVRL